MTLIKVLQDARYWLFVILAFTMVLQMVVFMHARRGNTSAGNNRLEKFIDMLEERKPLVRVADTESRRAIRSVREGSTLSDSSYEFVEKKTDGRRRRRTLENAESLFQRQQQQQLQIDDNPVAEFFDVDSFDPESNEDDNGSNSKQESIEEQQKLEPGKSEPQVSGKDGLDSEANQVKSNSKLGMSLIHSRMSERRGHYNRTWIPPSLIASHLIPDDVVKGVKYFLFFVGHGRGGSSNFGSLIDAHPHVVVATGYEIFRKWQERPEYHQNRSVLYTSLLLRSNIVSGMYRKTQDRNNSLYIDNSFMGQYNHSIHVIGENEAGSATSLFHIDSEKWVQSLTQMRSAIAVPIKTIQIVANPYDTIATMVVFDQGGPSKHNKLLNKTGTLSDAELVDFRIRSYFRNALAVSTMRSDSNLNLDLYQVHLQDLIDNPLETMKDICGFLGVTCFDWYLKTCKDHMGHVFKDVSISREMIDWSEAQISEVQQQIDLYPSLKEYSFTS